MRLWVGLAATLASLTLAGCFSSERALFSDQDAVVPITEGAIYEWRSNKPTERPQLVRFSRVGHGYVLRSATGDDDAPMQLLFASVIQTHDDDDIAQVDMDGEASKGFVYRFLWPLGDDRYRILTQSDRLNGAGRPTFDRCAESFSGCSFDSADDLRRHYLDVLYPILSKGRRPATYVDMIPVEPTAAPTRE